MRTQRDLMRAKEILERDRLFLFNRGSNFSPQDMIARVNRRRYDREIFF